MNNYIYFELIYNAYLYNIIFVNNLPFYLKNSWSAAAHLIGSPAHISPELLTLLYDVSVVNFPLAATDPNSISTSTNICALGTRIYFWLTSSFAWSKGSCLCRCNIS